MLLEFKSPRHCTGRAVFVSPAHVSGINYYGTDGEGPTTSVWLAGCPYPLLVLGSVRETAERLNAGEQVS